MCRQYELRLELQPLPTAECAGLNPPEWRALLARLNRPLKNSDAPVLCRRLRPARARNEWLIGATEVVPGYEALAAGRLFQRLVKSCPDTKQSYGYPIVTPTQPCSRPECFSALLFAILAAILIVSLRRCGAPGMPMLPTGAIAATCRSVTGGTVSGCTSVYRFQ